MGTMSWKRLASRVIPVLMLVSLLVSMGGVRKVTASSSRQDGGTLTEAFGVVVDTFNPAQTGYTADGWIIRDIFDSLVYITPDGKITPWLATSWKITNGGKTYTFNLRHDVTFQDGTPFDADAVVYNIHYYENPTTQAKNASGLGDYLSAKALSKYVFQYNMKAPYSPLLFTFGGWTTGMQSPTALQKYGTQSGNHPVGTGPFMFQSYIRPTTITLVRNPNYHWGPAAVGMTGPAKLDKIVFNVITQPSVLADELQTGQAQYAASVPTLQYEAMKTNPQFTPFPIKVSGAGVYTLINNKKFPTNDPAVRKAINMAIDKVGVIKLADAGQFPPTWGPLQIGTYGYDAALDNYYPYNVAKAAQVLEADGWKKVNGIWTKNGQQLTLRWTLIAQAGDYDDMGTAQIGYLTSFGIKVNSVAIAGTAWEASNTNGDFNMTGPLQFSDTDPDLLRLMLGKGQYFNWSGYANPTVWKLLDEAYITPNGPDRLKLYYQAQQIVEQDAWNLPIRLDEDLDMMSSRLKGVRDDFGGLPDYYTAYFAS
jgi:peptide/nickel transport system substrate-binding protein